MARSGFGQKRNCTALYVNINKENRRDLSFIYIVALRTIAKKGDTDQKLNNGCLLFTIATFITGKKRAILYRI